MWNNRKKTRSKRPENANTCYQCDGRADDSKDALKLQHFWYSPFPFPISLPRYMYVCGCEYPLDYGCIEIRERINNNFVPCFSMFKENLHMFLNNLIFCTSAPQFFWIYFCFLTPGSPDISSTISVLELYKRLKIFIFPRFKFRYIENLL